MDAGKLYSKKISLTSGTALEVMLKDTSGVSLECTYVDIIVDRSAASQDYVSITPSGIYASYNDLSSTGANSSGVGGVVATANVKGIIQVLPSQSFTSVRLFSETTVIVLLSYGNLITPNDRARGNNSQGL